MTEDTAAGARPSHIPPPVSAPVGEPYSETREFGVWAVLGVFVAGAVIGAGAAALFAPESGEKTRRQISRQFRRLTRRERSTWGRLRRTLDQAVERRKVRKAEAIVEHAG